MKCPFCDATSTQVRDSRPAEADQSVKRRRHCPECGGRFTTFERVEFRSLLVVKRDGSRQQFDRAKLKRSIDVAARKRKVTQDMIDRWVNMIVDDINKRSEGEVSSRMIGELIMNNLRAVDPVAYVRFASVYEDFQTVDDFTQVMRKIVLKTNR